MRIKYYLMCSVVIALLTACGGNNVKKVEDKVPSTEVKEVRETTVTTGDNQADKEVGEDRPQRDGIHDSFQVTEAGYEFTIPTYWGESATADHYQGYAEKDGKVAMLEIMVRKDSNGSVKADMFDKEEDRTAAIENVLGGMLKSGQATNGKILNSEIYETDAYRGALWKYRIDLQGIGLTAYYLMIPNEDENCLVMLNCGYTDNTEFRYDDDFQRLISMIQKKNDNTGEDQETTSLNPTEETQLEEENKETVAETEAATLETAESVAENKDEAKETTASQYMSIEAYAKFVESELAPNDYTKVEVDNNVIIIYVSRNHIEDAAMLAREDKKQKKAWDKSMKEIEKMSKVYSEQANEFCGTTVLLSVTVVSDVDHKLVLYSAMDGQKVIDITDH